MQSIKGAKNELARYTLMAKNIFEQELFKEWTVGTFRPNSSRDSKFPYKLHTFKGFFAFAPPVGRLMCQITIYCK